MTRARPKVIAAIPAGGVVDDGRSRKRKREQDLEEWKEDCPSPQNTDNVEEVEGLRSVADQPSIDNVVSKTTTGTKRSRGTKTKQDGKPPTPRKGKGINDLQSKGSAPTVKIEKPLEDVQSGHSGEEGQLNGTTPKSRGRKAPGGRPKDQSVQKDESVTVNTPKQSRPRSKKTPKEEAREDDLEVDLKANEAQTKPRRKKKATNNEGTEATDETVEQKPKKKRKTKEERERETMPLATRTQGLKYFVGAHVSIAKGLENAVTNCVHVGGNAFALFLKSRGKWANPPMEDTNRDAFRQHCTTHQYDGASHIVPHCSYLVNLAAPPTSATIKQSYDSFVDDLHRCEALGIKYYNFHPGAASKSPLPEAISRLAANLNRALSETTTVVPLLENMAGHGSIIGGRFEDLANVIAEISPEYKHRIGICFDTCHAFAAGYDLRTPESFKAVFEDFDKTIGLQYLKALHINDSKAPFRSHRDLHQNIGLGFLGLRAFHNVMNEPRLQNLPLILETPCDRPDPDKPGKTIDDKTVWAREIKLLESLTRMDPDGDEFKKLEADLAEEGRAEREKMMKWWEEKTEKAKKKLDKEKRKAEKGNKDIRKLFKKKDVDVDSESELSELSSELDDLSSEDEKEEEDDGK